MVKCRIVTENQCLESTMKHGLLTCLRLNYNWQNSKFSTGGSIVGGSNKVHKIVDNGDMCCKQSFLEGFLQNLSFSMISK